VTGFIAPDRVTEPVTAADVELASLLSPRELGILRLAARGCDNDAIAAELFLSVRTVERHLQNAYAKLAHTQGRDRARTVLSAVREGDGDRAMRIMAEHLKGTEHVLAGLLPTMGAIGAAIAAAITAAVLIGQLALSARDILRREAVRSSADAP